MIWGWRDRANGEIWDRKCWFVIVLVMVLLFGRYFLNRDDEADGCGAVVIGNDVGECMVSVMVVVIVLLVRNCCFVLGKVVMV